MRSTAYAKRMGVSRSLCSSFYAKSMIRRLQGFHALHLSNVADSERIAHRIRAIERDLCVSAW